MEESKAIKNGHQRYRSVVFLPRIYVITDHLISVISDVHGNSVINALFQGTPHYKRFDSMMVKDITRSFLPHCSLVILKPPT